MAAAKKLVMMSETKMLGKLRPFALDSHGRKAPRGTEEHSPLRVRLRLTPELFGLPARPSPVPGMRQSFSKSASFLAVEGSSPVHSTEVHRGGL